MILRPPNLRTSPLHFHDSRYSRADLARRTAVRTETRRLLDDRFLEFSSDLRFVLRAPWTPSKALTSFPPTHPDLSPRPAISTSRQIYPPPPPPLPAESTVYAYPDWPGHPSHLPTIWNLGQSRLPQLRDLVLCTCQLRAIPPRKELATRCPRLHTPRRPQQRQHSACSRAHSAFSPFAPSPTAAAVLIARVTALQPHSRVRRLPNACWVPAISTYRPA